jgi:hypothetical protein
LGLGLKYNLIDTEAIADAVAFSQQYNLIDTEAIADAVAFSMSSFAADWCPHAGDRGGYAGRAINNI